MSVIRVNKNNFNEIKSSSKAVLLDFYAPWCGPCKMMGPIVKELADSYDGKMKIGKLNIDEEMDIAQKYRVMSIPTFIIFKKGQPVETIVGGMPKAELEAKIKKVLGES